MEVSPAMFLLSFRFPHGAQGVENRENRYTDIGEDRQPHRRVAERAKEHTDRLDQQRKDNILLGNATGALRDPQQTRQL